MSQEWWKHLDHDLSQLIRLHREINAPSFGSYPEAVRRGINVAYAAHFRTIMEFAHRKRPKREGPPPKDITSAALLDEPLSEKWTEEEERRLADADKLVGHLSRGRVEREGEERDWGCPEDADLWAPYSERLLAEAGENLPESMKAAAELRKEGEGATGDKRKLGLDAFFLGQRLTMHAYGVGEEPLSDSPDLFGILREIAHGEFTLHSTPGEMTAPHPNMDSDFRDFMFSHANEVMAREREVARIVLDALDSIGRE